MNREDLSFYDSKQYKLTLCLVMAVFFYVFMAFFLPFGIDNYDPDHRYDPEFFLELFYFFAILLAFLLFNEFILRPLFISTTTFTKIVVWSIWTLIAASTLIFLTYNILGDWHDLYLKSFLGFIRDVTAVLIFPLFGVFFYFKYRSMQSSVQHFLTEKDTPSHSNDRLLHFQGAGSKDQITLSVKNFLYGRAQDNYVELYYLEKGEAQKFMMRATLNSLAEELVDTAICRSHRSYIVNLLHVNSIKGNNQDTTLFLSPLDTPVPVSKTYKNNVLRTLREIKEFA